MMSETALVAREIEKQGEGMRILISETSMRLIQKVGGFRCESRGTLDVKVQYPVHNFLKNPQFFGIVAQRCDGNLLACRP